MATGPNFGDPGDLERWAKDLNVEKTAPKYQMEQLSKSNPLPWQKYIDPSISGDSNDIVNQQLNRNNSDYYDASFNRGVDFSPPKAAPTGNAMLDAINNKYASQYGTKYSGLALESDTKKPAWQSSQLNRTAGVLGTVQANEMQNFREQFQYQQQRQQLYQQWKSAQDQAKGSFLSSILQIGLGAIATFATGGAAAPAVLGAGAIAGVNAGSGR